MQQDGKAFPGIVIAALRGGAGKTILSIGIIAALKSFKKNVAPFKKGPDYIDAGWLAMAAGRPCYNLDNFLIEEKQILNSFYTHTLKSDIAVIEGNRGLYDGLDTEGSTSTAELAKLLNLPVILCLDCTKSTRTMAAVVLGCIKFDPTVKIKGIILNRVAGSRHENIVRKSIESYCGIPVLGAVPKLGKQNFPERHMGLIPTPEHEWANDSINAALNMAKSYIDLDSLIEIAHDISRKEPEESISRPEIIIKKIEKQKKSSSAPKIGIIKDSAFQFYYPENIDALVAAGADTVFISPLKTNKIPSVDALYIGGGFPETHAKKLSENEQFRNELKALAENGLPIYAECGGLMYLGEELVLNNKSYQMAGVLPVVFGLSKKPKGHGYTIISVEKENKYFKKGSEIRGHEFHYSYVLEWNGKDEDLIFNMKRGNGFINKKDGVCYKNVLATYTHIHALGTPSWAKAMVSNAISYKKTQ
ncbi:MAG: hydrogenobyrinic acid a,c-diamide synthase (glutamine-hydrolyzing) [Deltaproteobacteria bacterium]|jgi:cobyrinic acid a,c-diamide synthase|nr:hydrogenobyrinic acid a,c-diamide synthase (glutamine-hydrolyzing) [Deltaproteobacteria bacterium]